MCRRVRRSRLRAAVLLPRPVQGGFATEGRLARAVWGRSSAGLRPVWAAGIRSTGASRPDAGTWVWPDRGIGPHAVRGLTAATIARSATRPGGDALPGASDCLGTSPSYYETLRMAAHRRAARATSCWRAPTTGCASTRSTRHVRLGQPAGDADRARRARRAEHRGGRVGLDPLPATSTATPGEEVLFARRAAAAGGLVLRPRRRQLEPSCRHSACA